MDLLNGIVSVFNPSVFIFVLLGVLAGISFGAVPGLDASTGTALLIPLTYGLQPLQALAFLCALYVGGVFGGSITAILFRVPGASEAVMTSLDGYPMAKQGQAGRALGISIMSSSLGGTLATIVMFLLTLQLANIALKFGPAEYMALAILGLSCMSSVGANSQLKSLFSCCFGLLLATVGVDYMSGVTRFTFGWAPLLSGVPLIPALIGLFAATEIFTKISDKNQMELLDEGFSKTAHVNVKTSLKDVWRMRWTILRGSAIGTWIGILPGVGATTAAVVSYSQEVRFSKTPEEFGKGKPEGVCAAESANNAAAVGALIPLLSLGIPGSGTTAILVSAFLLHGLSVGPLLFQNHRELVYSLFGSVFIANFLIILGGLFLVRPFIRLVKLPYPIMATSILTFCIVGSLAVNGASGVIVMFIFGIIGFGMTRMKYPVAPVILGIILGSILETNLRRALLMNGGEFLPLLGRPITLVLILLSLTSFTVPYIGRFRSWLKIKQHAGTSQDSAPN